MTHTHTYYQLTITAYIDYDHFPPKFSIIFDKKSLPMIPSTLMIMVLKSHIYRLSHPLPDILTYIILELSVGRHSSYTLASFWLITVNIPQFSQCTLFSDLKICLTLLVPAPGLPWFVLKDWIVLVKELKFFSSQTSSTPLTSLTPSSPLHFVPMWLVLWLMVPWLAVSNSLPPPFIPCL